MKEPISYWHWVSDNILGLVGTNSIYHIDLTQADSVATPVFNK